MPQFYQEGAYSGTVIEQGFGESKEKKTPFFFLKVKVEATEDGQPVDKQYERTVTRYITETTVEYLAEDLKALGFQWNDSFSDLHPLNPKHHSFVGQSIPLYCKWEGEYERWQISRPLGGGQQVDQLGSAEMRKLDNMFGKAMKGGAPAASKPVAARQSQPVAAGNIGDDDLPF